MHERPDPPLDQARWIQIERLFEGALAQPAADREDWLRDACEDADVRAAVGRLLAADAAGGPLDGGLTASVNVLLCEASFEQSPPPLVGTCIGSWRLLDEIGHGGMGVVYLAERADGAFQQHAALKLIHGMGGGEAVRRRFLRERQILARLEHPGIARLLDGGYTEEGMPYLVMERIEGVPITDYAKRHSLTIRDRIELLLQVCEAVVHAHGHLIVHCDLKPPNILVTPEGRVRLLDFGIAHLLGNSTADGQPLAHTNFLAVTPEYAAPEQLRGEAVSTATDTYALGAVLYELLSGRRPFDLKSHALVEVLQRVECEPAPLGRLPGVGHGLRSQLRGDLETIVAKAMHRDPARRYLSVEAFAAELRRYLEGRPVLARPATPGYRLGRYLRRHRFGAAAAALVILSLLAGLAGTWWQFRLARHDAARAQAVAGFLFELFASVDPERARGREVNARELVEEGAVRVASLPEGSDLRIEALTTLGQLYTSLGLYERSEALLRQALTEARTHLGSDTPLAVRALTGLATNLMQAGRYPEAESLASTSLSLRQAGVDNELTGDSLLLLAQLARLQGRIDEAERRFRQALDWTRVRHGPESVEAASVLHSLALMLEESERLEEAERLAQHALAIRRERLGEDHPDVGRSLGLLAAIRGTLGNLAEAERLHREELALMRRIYRAEHPSIASALDQVAIYVDRQGRYPEAETLYREALALRERLLGPMHPDLASTINNLSTLYYRTGDLKRAAEAQRQALEIWRATLGEDHWKVATATNNLGVMLRDLGQFAQAEALLQAGLATRRRTLGESHSDVGASLNNLATLRRLRGDLTGAERDYRAALENFSASLPADHWRIADAAHGLGLILAAQGQVVEARASFEQALAIRRASFVVGDPRIAETERALQALTEGEPGGAVRP